MYDKIKKQPKATSVYQDRLVITGDLTQIAAQVPELFEALSGMKMSDLFGKLTTIGDKSKNHDQLPPPDGSDKAAGGRK